MSAFLITCSVIVATLAAVLFAYYVYSGDPLALVGALFLVVGLALCLTAAPAGAAIIRTPDGQIARPEQNWLNVSTIKLPKELSLTLDRTNTGLHTDWCGETFPDTAVVQTRCGRSTLYHEAFHVIVYQQRYTPWFAHMAAAYVRINPEDKGKSWFDDNIPYDDDPQEHAANAFEDCAGRSASKWRSIWDARALKTCQMFDRHMSELTKF